MDPLQSLLTWCLLGALFCGGMPLFGGALLYQGLHKYSAGEIPLRKCIKCFFIAARDGEITRCANDFFVFAPQPRTVGVFNS